jgi:hypothetical protein
MAMSSKAQARTLHTLRTIMLQHQHEGKMPQLNAVATIFTNLLSQGAGDEAWQIFHKVAGLPLVTTRLEVSCVAQGNPCEQRSKRGHCWHGLVSVPYTIQLDMTDHLLFDIGRRNNGPQLMSWWGKQLALALGAVAV